MQPEIHPCKRLHQVEDGDGGASSQKIVDVADKGETS